MGTRTDNLKPIHSLAVIVVNALALVVFVCSAHAPECPLLALSIVAFILVQVFFPACRPCISAPLSPANVAQAFFWVQLVLVPLLIGFFGFSIGTLPHLPSSAAINLAIGLHALGYVSYCAAFQYFSASVAESDANSGQETPSSRTAPATVYLVVPFVGLGLLGLYLSFGGVAGYLDHISSPIHQRLSAEEPTTLANAAGGFLRHFLGFGIVLAWSGWLGRGGQPRRTWTSIGVATLLMALLLVANFSYNRGSMLAPLMAVAAAYSLQVRRIPIKAVAFAGAAALAVAFTFGWYRSTDLEINEVNVADLSEAWNDSNMLEFAQIYASAPQLPAYLLEDLDYEGKLYYGTTLLPSLIYPVPVLGKPYREASGVVIFNDLIYGDPEIIDQNIPFDAEFYMNFHVPGVTIGYALLGWLLSFFQRKFLAAPNAIESYSWFLLGLWTIFPGSLPVASQMYVYAFWPIYTYWFVKFAWSWRVPQELFTTESQSPQRMPVGVSS